MSIVLGWGLLAAAITISPAYTSHQARVWKTPLSICGHGFEEDMCIFHNFE